MSDPINELSTQENIDITKKINNEPRKKVMDSFNQSLKTFNSLYEKLAE